MINSQNPLLVLVSKDEVDLQKLANLLSNFIGIEKSGKIFFKSTYLSLGAAEKIQYLLLASKARFLLNLSKTEKLSPKEITILSKLPEGTVKSTLKRLREKGMILSEESLYFFPNYRVNDFKQESVKKKEGVKNE